MVVQPICHFFISKSSKKGDVEFTLGELVREAVDRTRRRLSFLSLRDVVVDRTSPRHLSDDVFRHVLSFLSLRDVVVVGAAFSRRLSFIEADILDLDVLDFSGISLDTESKLHSFHRFMDWLTGRHRKRLGRFYLSLSSSQACPIEPERIRSWIDFAAESEVQHLSVDLFPRVDICLPDSVADLPRLQSLHFPGCRLPCVPVHWPHLKELSWGEIVMGSYFPCYVFDGSPALELLKLQGCSGSRCEIATDDRSSLRGLVIDSSRCDQVRIHSPNLIILRLLGCWQSCHNGYFFRCTLPSLVKAELDFSFNDADGRETGPPYSLVGLILYELLYDLEDAPTLHIGRRCLETVAYLCNNDPNIEEDFTKCKHLIIGSMSDRICTCEIISLLDKFPPLDELEIRGLWIDHEYEVIPGYIHQRRPCLRLGPGVEFASSGKYLTRVKTLVLRLSKSCDRTSNN